MRRWLTTPLLLLALLASPAAVADQNSPGLDRLFQRLKTTDDPAEARAVEDAIWDEWLHCDKPGLEKLLALGIVEASRGHLKSSLALFDRVVQGAPDFAEGWNKRATIYYMLGDYDASVADIRRTLALEPRHFGALSGMGLIFEAIGDNDAAIKVWEKALEIHPHMDLVRQRIKELRARGKGNPT